MQMLIYAIFCSVILFSIIIMFNKNLKIFISRRKLYILMVLLYCVILIIVYYFITIIFDDIDKCLDNGGSWDKEYNICLH
jgi:hypothetical protein